MSRVDRAVRRALGRLGQDETLMASAVGYEPEGRRRLVALLTDRRLVVTGLRTEAPIELGLSSTSGSYEADGSRLVLDADGTSPVVLRAVEEPTARQIVALLADHRTLPASASAPRVRHVHLHWDEDEDEDEPPR